MRVTCPAMLDFSQLATPTDHAETLVAPEPAKWRKAIEANADALRGAGKLLLGKTLGHWRERTRQKSAGTDDRFLVVTGHQPGFIHPGVWAKHVVAVRFAHAIGGIAINLVVDSDVPKRMDFSIPTVAGDRIALKNVRFAEAPVGLAYEQLPPLTSSEANRFRESVRSLMGSRYAQSAMPDFCAALASNIDANDWVDQVLRARHTIEASFGVVLEERRVSSIWCTPLFGDMLLNADTFADSYNAALAAYRTTHRIRGAHRPIPDLRRTTDRIEVPIWAYRADEPRRRLWVTLRNKTRELFADDVRIGEIAVSELGACDRIAATLGDWRLRPRALTLTIWARLLLADLFIHGIGGAKYDRISDRIIADYYGLEPPHMACVSATLFPGLPVEAVGAETVRELRCAVRDLRFNPQRHLPLNGTMALLARERSEAVRRSIELADAETSDSVARRKVFSDIRRLNREMLGAESSAEGRLAARLEAAVAASQQHKIARGREYFFGLYAREALEELLEALPDEHDFGV